MTDPDGVADRRLDANAAAGPLAELFTVDLTAAVATCAGCGNRAPLAAHPLYADAPALVVRCPNCARCRAALRQQRELVAARSDRGEAAHRHAWVGRISGWS
jgi:hypothetical protein